MDGRVEREEPCPWQSAGSTFVFVAIMTETQTVARPQLQSIYYMQPKVILTYAGLGVSEAKEKAGIFT